MDYVVIVNYGINRGMLDIKVVGTFPNVVAAEQWINDHETEAESVDHFEVRSYPLYDPGEGIAKQRAA